MSVRTHLFSTEKCAKTVNDTPGTERNAAAAAAAKLREEEDEGDNGGTGGMDKARAGAGEVFLHALVASIHRGTHPWRASASKVVNVYPKRNIEGKEIIGTVSVLNKEWPTVIMVKS
jgi:hypothetical protein